MQPRSLEQIISELNPTYQPQIDMLRQRQSLIPGQIAEEEKGLEARQTQAFGDILSGARRRGLGFAGIPLAEQAKYTSTEFLPALARLRQQGKEQAMSLEEAILGIGERRNTLAQQLRQQEIDRAEAWRRYEEEKAFAREQAARSGGGGGSPSFGFTAGGGGGAAGGGAAVTVTQPEQNLYNIAKSLYGRIGSDASATSEFQRMLQNAEKGNANAKQVLRHFYSFRGGKVPDRAARAMA